MASISHVRLAQSYNKSGQVKPIGELASYCSFNCHVIREFLVSKLQLIAV